MASACRLATCKVASVEAQGPHGVCFIVFTCHTFPHIIADTWQTQAGTGHSQASHTHLIVANTTMANT